MRRLRDLLAVLLVALGIAATALGQATAPPPRRVADPMAAAKKRQQLDAILKLWEQQGAGRTTIDATFVRLDASEVWGNAEYRGKAYLKSPNLLHLELKKLDKAKQPPVLVPHEQIICTGNHVLQYAHETKQIFVFPLARAERKRVLDEGPLPFLFNMRADELKKRYTLSLPDENKDVYLIGVVPLWESDQETFSKAYIWLNKANFFPHKLVLVAPNEKDKKQYTFTLIRENEPLNADLFRGRRVAGWQVIENPAAPQPPPPERAEAQVPQRDRR